MGPKIKSGSCWSPQTAPSGRIFTRNHNTCKQWRNHNFKIGGGGSSAVGASRVEAPKAPRGCGVGSGCPPPHWGRPLGRGACPLPRKCFDFLSENWWVLVHSGWHKRVRQKRKEEKELWWRTTFCTDRWTTNAPNTVISSLLKINSYLMCHQWFKVAIRYYSQVYQTKYRIRVWILYTKISSHCQI